MRIKMNQKLCLVGLILVIAGSNNAQRCALEPDEINIMTKSGVIRTPNYIYSYYPPNQRCYWTLHGAPNQILVLRVEMLNTGPQSVTCNTDYITFPNGLRLCGNSAPKNCYAFAPEGMMEQGCDYMLPSCGCGMNVYSVDKWPPVIGFYSNARSNYKGASINFTFVDCPLHITSLNISSPTPTDKQTLLEAGWTAFRVAVIVSALFGATSVILAFLLYYEKKKKTSTGRKQLLPQPSDTSNRSKEPPTGRRVPSARPPQTPPSVSSIDTGYVNSFIGAEDQNSYDYVQPVTHNTSHYEQPISRTSAYVDIR